MAKTPGSIDVIVADAWMAFPLIGIGHGQRINRFIRADALAVDHLRARMALLKNITRTRTATHLMLIPGISFTATWITHALADVIAPWTWCDVG